LKNKGIKFRLVISGSINPHFPNYKSKFKEILDSYSDIIYEYLGYVKEKDIINLFLKSDLIILSYNIPGGHSGVLEQSMFFNLPAIVLDFTEYREQAKGNPLVKIIKPEEIGNALILNLNLKENDIIEVKNKIILTQDNIKSIANTISEGN